MRRRAPAGVGQARRRRAAAPAACPAPCGWCTCSCRALLPPCVPASRLCFRLADRLRSCGVSRLAVFTTARSHKPQAQPRLRVCCGALRDRVGPRAARRLGVAPDRVSLPLGVNAGRVGLVERGAAAGAKAHDERRDAERPHAAALRVLLLHAGDPLGEVLHARALVQREPVGLRLGARAVHEHARVGREPREREADVLVHAHDLAHGPRVLQLRSRLLLHACTRRGRAACPAGLGPACAAVPARRRSTQRSPRTMMSVPRTPTASVPFLTASCAYSTWNLRRMAYSAALAVSSAAPARSSRTGPERKP